MQESQHTEWKQSWRDEFLKWICGFANAEGGVLVIGKNDDGEPVGLSNVKELLEEIPNKVRNLLGIIVEVNLREEQGIGFLEIRVAPYPYPVSYKGQYHLRSGSTKQELKGAALDKFLLRKQGNHWDGVPVPNLSVKQLSREVIDRFRNAASQSLRLDSNILSETTTGLMGELHLMDDRYLKRAAVLLFHPDPEKFITGAFVKVGFFRNNADLLYHDEIQGDLFTQVDKTLDLLRTKYLKAGISYEGTHRIERLPVPEEALRETVLNAIAHKDYSSGTPIQISVYDDKLMVWNPGQLPVGWTVEHLKEKHSSRPSNPDVANTFFRAGMIESWGRGFERIFEACRSVKSPAPKLKYEGEEIWVEFPFRRSTLEKPGETRGETRGETSAGILILIEGNSKITIPQMAKNLGLSEKGVEWQLNKLKEKNLIQRVGPNKGGHWELIK